MSKNDPLDIAATAVANMKRIEAAHKVSMELAALVQTAVTIRNAERYKISFFINNKTTPLFDDCGDLIKQATLAALTQNITALHAEIDRLGCAGEVTLEMPEEKNEDTDLPF